jgi:hypothetical protein
MTSLSSWRRNFEFTTGFNPDLFGATWDGNNAPQLQPGPVSTTFFRGGASFSGNLRGRAMEFAIPWNIAVGDSAIRRFDPALQDTIWTIPRGTVLKIAGAITGGGDGNGGPDSAPDKTGCHNVDANQLVIIDNFASLPLDVQNDTGAGAPGPDGIPDFDVSPRERVSFRFEPPVPCKPLESSTFDLSRPAIAPHRGEVVPFDFEFKLRLDPDDPADRRRIVRVYADVFDLRGRRVRALFPEENRCALDQRDPCRATNPCQVPATAACRDVWDGRDDAGGIVPPGVYVMRVVMVQPFATRLTRPVVVVQ